jgi:nitroreductase
MNVRDIEVRQHRKPDHQIEPLFLQRWSPRAMSGEAVSREELMRLFEAARWAPSSYNHQPWRFVYTFRDTPTWDPLFGTLVEFNQSWCKNAGALVVICSRTLTDSGKPIKTHSFDTGAAWQNLALQGTPMGLVVHAMQGFDYERAAEVIAAPEGIAVDAMFAVGKPGDSDDLPEGLRERESPSGRHPVGSFTFEGKFG